MENRELSLLSTEIKNNQTLLHKKLQINNK